ncbi:hypothetical protein [Rhizobium ruizarguesonis]|uniref:hypothetical protein n=1 Tax=Rhizobium ruizarguesonis TaxID=2081791 RepID=UPI0013EECCE2|nr:hypothetical protein [Rhizobium ruizarguesonis]
MTYELERQIEELRAELRNAVYKDEREWILKELVAAEAQLAEQEAAFDALLSADPPE